MTVQAQRTNRAILASFILLGFLLFGCSRDPGYCPEQSPADLSRAIANIADDQLKFRFPLDKLGNFVWPGPAIFSTSGYDGSKVEYHAAEDYHLPPGTPVYAIADGTISFSGPMGGYGWLIIVDHPQFNLYSLYGHLSPSRWRSDKGPVVKGDLIGYLGDLDENGGSAENPLRPHLHFGIRAGQREDYPGWGEWRWMAGWIMPCPKNLGWLKPSEVLTSQVVPAGGYPMPRAGLMEKWGAELAFFGLYLAGGVVVLVLSLANVSKVKPWVYGGLMIVAGVVLGEKATRGDYALFGLAALMFAFSGVRAIRRWRSNSEASSQ